MKIVSHHNEINVQMLVSCGLNCIQFLIFVDSVYIFFFSIFHSTVSLEQLKIYGSVEAQNLQIAISTMKFSGLKYDSLRRYLHRFLLSQNDFFYHEIQRCGQMCFNHKK